MPEQARPTEQFDPSRQPELPEITNEQVLGASAEDIVTAAAGESERLQALLPTVEHGGVQWNSLRNQIYTVSQTASEARHYGNTAHLTGFITFGQHLTARMEDVSLDTPEDAEKYVRYQKIEDWLTNQSSLSDGGAIGDVLRRKQEQPVVERSSAVQREVEPAYEPPSEAVQPEQAVANARKSVESARNAELFNDIVGIGKNNTQLHTDVLRGFMDLGDGMPANRKLAYIPEGFREVYKRDHKATDWRQELNETIMFSDVIERDEREVTVRQQTRGRFGLTHTTEHAKTEAVPGSERPKMIRNELTGNTEPAVRFRYNFNLRSNHASAAVNKGELPDYREFGGHRNGQTVSTCVELPKSIADRLQSQVRDDPTSVRLLVENLFLSNNDGSMTEEHWRQGRKDVGHPVRPPYEQLPPDWTIAVISNQEGPGSNDSYDARRV